MTLPQTAPTWAIRIDEAIEELAGRSKAARGRARKDAAKAEPGPSGPLGRAAQAAVGTPDFAAAYSVYEASDELAVDRARYADWQDQYREQLKGCHDSAVRKVIEAVRAGELTLHTADGARLVLKDVRKQWDALPTFVTGHMQTFGSALDREPIFFEQEKWTKWVAKQTPTTMPTIADAKRWLQAEVAKSPEGKPEGTKKAYYIAGMMKMGVSERTALAIWKEVCRDGHHWTRPGRPKKTPAQ